ncbi:hypothetical protein GWI33_000528 [Rhynchophorus ferrugineus]|uniref:Uncharacterized protein n=1 Tax=Rhynchophorus ferrugineus TaxID=354439 RepID=A0A834IQZ4_RHYFE|nr:hypothetical protein GWI33_000528 [Rhynchophorus ferrugineus]
MILSWEPPEESICPSSIAKFFSDLECTVNVCQPQFDTQILFSVKMPMIFQQNIQQGDVEQFVEWLGMVAIDGDFSGSFDNYINTYEAPEPSTEIGQIRFLQWRGMYLSKHLGKLIDLLREYNNEANTFWIAAYIQGFSDMPIIKSNQENHYFTNGDNATVLIFNNDKCIFCSQRCSMKKYK